MSGELWAFFAGICACLAGIATLLTVAREKGIGWTLADLDPGADTWSDDLTALVDATREDERVASVHELAAGRQARAGSAGARSLRVVPKDGDVS